MPLPIDRKPSARSPEPHQKPAEEDQPKGASDPQTTRENEQAAKPATAAEGLTPEQLKIRELEAQLAAAKASTAHAPRKRSQQVAPQAGRRSTPRPRARRMAAGTGDAAETCQRPGPRQHLRSP